MLVNRWFHRLPLRLRARRRPRRWRLPPARALAGLAACLAVVATSSGPTHGQSVERPYIPPVTAPVADGFRPPPNPFGPGNRGIDYDTDPGTEVRASAQGEVVFAGEVAGSLHVTLLHDDGVRTSYSFLESVDVAVGQSVGQGDRVGRAGERFHFGARRGDAYFDPAMLFGPSPPAQVELLPFEVPPGATADEERAALFQLGFSWSLGDGGGGGFGIDLPGLDDLASWATERARVLQHYSAELSPLRRSMGVTWDIATRLASPPPCSDAPPPAQPAAQRGPRAAVLVGGLGSSSDSASIDGLRVGELGYRAEDVVRFSYAGGRTPASGDRFRSVDVTPYVSIDTQGDLRASAQRLADLVQAALAERPETTIDLYAHSMGGVVTRLALIELERRGTDLDRLGLVTTFGSPHRGADLATAVAAGNTTLLGASGLDAASTLLDLGLDPDSPAAAQLAETSDVTRGLVDTPIPAGIELISIAASGDLVVTAPNTEVAGARNITVGMAGWEAHGDLVESDEATDEVARALAGEPPACESAWEVVSEELTGEAISYAEDLGGFAAMQPGG